METSEKLDSLPGYPFAGVAEAQRKLREEGVDVINLGAGDADLDPPPAVVERLREAAGETRMSRYAFQLGLPEFRETIAAWMKERFGVDVDPYEEVLPLIGSKEGLAKLPFGLLNRGDMAIMPDPGYMAYQGGVALAGGKPWMVPLRPENDFLIPLDGLRGDVPHRARLLYLNYPNNPTSAAAPDEYYREAIDFCARHRQVLVHDNAYSEIAFDGYRPRSIMEFEGARDVAIEFHSLSKTYNMTGWRLGWAVGGREVISTLSRVKSFMDTGAFLGVQAAGVAALESWSTWVPENVAVFKRRRDVAVAALRTAGFSLEAPKATMYLWMPVPGGEASKEFSARVLQETGVWVLPGASLGAGGEGFFRIALTVPEERLEEAAQRLAQVL